MGGADPLIRSLILAALTAALGLFSGAAYVLSQSRHDPIQALLANESSHRRAIEGLARRAGAYRAALGIARTAAVSGLVFMLASQAGGIPPIGQAAWVGALVLCAEYIPRRFLSGPRVRAIVWSERLARYTCYGLYPFARMLGAWAGDGRPSDVLDRNGSRNSSHPDGEYEGQPTSLADTERALEHAERAMIHRILEFPDTVVSDVMVPRTDMVCVAADSTLDEVRRVIRDKPLSRIPVFDESIDNIVGILHLKDLFQLWGSGETDIRAIMRTTFLVVPDSKRINELFAEFRRAHQHLAVVLDEYGGTAGLVTIEDVLEEIVGEIQDEYDSEEPDVVQVGEGVYDLHGRVPIEELNESLELGLPEEAVNTIGGFLVDLVGRVPSAGQAIEIENGGLKFEVLEADGRRIRRVRLTVCPPGSEKGSNGEA